jgi:tyrosyl-tRNA synthetase
MVFPFIRPPDIDGSAARRKEPTMTYRPKSDFMAVMMERGYLADCTDYQGLDEALSQGVVPAYIGYDATAKSLHVGHLLNVMMLRWLQRTGHKPITLMGGGTTKVGDPSFRAEERPLLTPAQIDENISGMQQVFARYLDYDTLEERTRNCSDPDEMRRFIGVLRSYYKRQVGQQPEDRFERFIERLSPKSIVSRYHAELKHSSTHQSETPEHFITKVLARELKAVLRMRRPNSALMLNNAEWLDHLNYLDFLRDIGRHFSVNRMLSFESVKSRLDREQSLSFLEFNYMILQAYDFLELYRRYGCRLQMGGSDQWGNIVNGIDLTRRVLDVEIWGLTSPLLTTSDGRKMGKSAGGAVWLSAEMLSPYEFWQFWRNTTDADVGRFLKLYTELPVDECDRLGALAGSEINAAKIILANEVTGLLHGAEAAHAAEATAREVFEKGGAGEDLPTLTLAADEVAEGVSVAQLFVRAGLAKSGKDARRLIEGGGAKLDDADLSDAGLMLDAARLAQPVKLSAGRKRHALVKLG